MNSIAPKAACHSGWGVGGRRHCRCTRGCRYNCRQFASVIHRRRSIRSDCPSHLCDGFVRP